MRVTPQWLLLYRVVRQVPRPGLLRLGHLIHARVRVESKTSSQYKVQIGPRRGRLSERFTYSFLGRPIPMYIFIRLPASDPDKADRLDCLYDGPVDFFDCIMTQK